MTTIDTTKTLAELVIERPERAEVFEQLGLDYCCGGKQTLQQACDEKGISVDGVVRHLIEAERTPAYDEVDWSQAKLTELCEHIVQTHHAYLRHALPRLSELAKKVMEAHGQEQPYWHEVREVYENMRLELHMHMQKEEQVLFPAIEQMEQANAPLRFGFGSIANPIRMMHYEHDTTAAALRTLDQLTNHYTPAEDACPTTRALLAGLAALEKDLHQHIHKENNILFPRAIALEEQLIGS